MTHHLKGSKNTPLKMFPMNLSKMAAKNVYAILNKNSCERFCFQYFERQLQISVLGAQGLATGLAKQWAGFRAAKSCLEAAK